MIRDRNGNTSDYTYDHQGNMTSATDGRGMPRSYVYDADAISLPRRMRWVRRRPTPMTLRVTARP